MKDILSQICENKKVELEKTKKDVHFLHLKKYFKTKIIETLKN